MARKLIITIQNDTTQGAPLKVTKVYWDKDWEEYRVVFYVNGIKRQCADYHTTDEADAYNTAKTEITK